MTVLSPNETSFVTDADRKGGGCTAIIPFEAAQEEHFAIKRELEVTLKVKAKEHPGEIIISITLALPKIMEAAMILGVRYPKSQGRSQGQIPLQRSLQVWCCIV